MFVVSSLFRNQIFNLTIFFYIEFLSSNLDKIRYLKVKERFYEQYSTFYFIQTLISYKNIINDNMF